MGPRLRTRGQAKFFQGLTCGELRVEHVEPDTLDVTPGYHAEDQVFCEGRRAKEDEMTLLNAPKYDETQENRKRNALIAVGVAIVAAVLLALGGFFAGHGWFFMNLPAEHRVKVFLNIVQAGDYAKAYGIWQNDPDWQKHPDRYKDYTLSRFTEDWTTASDWHGPVRSFHVDVSKRDATGTVVAATINSSKRLFLKYQKKDGTLSYFPLELEY